MWANFAVVALDVGELAEAARAVGRVVEQTDGKAGVDVDVLDRLVDAVARGEEEAAPADVLESAATTAAVTGDASLQGGGHDPNSSRALSKTLFALFDRVLLPRVASRARLSRIRTAAHAFTAVRRRPKSAPRRVPRRPRRRVSARGHAGR